MTRSGMNIYKTAALSVDAATFVHSQSVLGTPAAAGRAPSSVSSSSHFGDTAGGGRALEANNGFDCRRRPMDRKRRCVGVCLPDQSVCHALAVCRREAEIAHLAVVRAQLEKVRPDSRQGVVVDRQILWSAQSPRLRWP
jgi:hypothetical protein